MYYDSLPVGQNMTNSAPYGARRELLTSVKIKLII